MDMVAERVWKTREENWESAHQEGHPLNRTLAIAHLGGATLDNYTSVLGDAYYWRAFNELQLNRLDPAWDDVETAANRIRENGLPHWLADRLSQGR